MTNSGRPDNGTESVEKKTRKFYDSVGWVPDRRGVTGEDTYFRDYGEEYTEYRQKIDAKPASLLKNLGGTILFAGPGDLPESHVQVARRFDKAICVDISERSVEICNRKLGKKAECLLASILDLPLEDGCVDATLCTHVLYHIDKRYQKKAVKELLRVTRPGGSIVIVYCNPNSPFMFMQNFLKILKVNRLLGKEILYTYYYPLSWWRQFSENNSIEIMPHHAISRNQSKVLLPGRFLKRNFFNWAMKLEDRKPDLATKLWSYVTVKIDRIS